MVRVPLFPTAVLFISGQLEAFQTTPVTFGFWGVVGAAVGRARRVQRDHFGGQPRLGGRARRSFLKHRLYGFLMMVSAGLVLILGLLIASLVRLAETRLSEAMVRSPWIDNLSGVFASYLATALLIGCVALVFKYIPNTKVRFRDVWPGAILVGVLWRIALSLFSWYAADLATWNVIHGSIAAVVVFLLWIYVSAVILIYGVEMTASYARLQEAAIRHTSMSKELQATNEEPRSESQPQALSPKTTVISLNAESAGGRAESLSSAAREQPRRLVSLGPGGVRGVPQPPASPSFCRSVTRPATGVT